MLINLHHSSFLKLCNGNANALLILLPILSCDVRFLQRMDGDTGRFIRETRTTNRCRGTFNEIAFWTAPARPPPLTHREREGASMQ